MWIFRVRGVGDPKASVLGPKAVVADRRPDAALVVLRGSLHHGAIPRDAADYLALDALRYADIASKFVSDAGVHSEGRPASVRRIGGLLVGCCAPAW